MHDQSEQYREFLRGNKALCVLELRKDPVTYNCAFVDVSAKCGQYDTDYTAIHVHAWHSPEGAELVLARDFAMIEQYMNILHARDWSEHRHSYQVELGRGFGYDIDSCIDYADNWTPEFCSCSKCVGVHKALQIQAERG